MTKIVCFSIVCFLIFSCSTSSVAGKYETNFPTFGKLNRTLTLNCDNTFVLNYKGDIINENFSGKWSKMKDTLVLKYDSDEFMGNVFDGQQKLLIGSKKLKNPFPISEADYHSLENLVRQEGWQNKISLPTYSRFKREQDKAPVDFEGNMKKQYFEKTESLDCN